MELTGAAFVLAGSIRDDGPLPDVYTDVVDAADQFLDLIERLFKLSRVSSGNLMSAVRRVCSMSRPRCSSM